MKKVIQGRSLRGCDRYLEILRNGENSVWFNITNSKGEERCVWEGDFQQVIASVQSAPIWRPEDVDNDPNLRVQVVGISRHGTAIFKLAHFSPTTAEDWNSRTGKCEDCSICIQNGGTVGRFGRDWLVFVPYDDVLNALLSIR